MSDEVPLYIRVTLPPTKTRRVGVNSTSPPFGHRIVAHMNIEEHDIVMRASKVVDQTMTASTFARHVLLDFARKLLADEALRKAAIQERINDITSGTE